MKDRNHQVALFVRCPEKNRIRLDGACFVWCESQETLIRAARAFDYDVLVVDITGDCDIIRALRDASSSSAIIAVSHSSDPNRVIEAFRLGVSDCCLSPVVPEELLWAIEKACMARYITPALGADFEVFRVTHAMGLCDSPETMKGLAVRALITILKASGGTALSGDVPAAMESLPVAVGEYEALHPRFLDTAFESDLSIHSERWVEGEFAFVPLCQRWMGALFFWGVREASERERARMEYVVRCLETCLEHHERYMGAKKLTYTDDLTHLYNQRYLSVYLSELLEEKKEFSVLFIDIDRFKTVNDTHGHWVGSSLLVQMGKRLCRMLRPCDVLFRYGGDEFIAVLETGSGAKAREIGERVREAACQRAFHIGESSIPITVSIGIALFPQDGDSVQKVIEMADQAMYQSKRSGRNRVHAFQHEAA